MSECAVTPHAVFRPGSARVKLVSIAGSVIALHDNASREPATAMVQWVAKASTAKPEIETSANHCSARLEPSRSVIIPPGSEAAAPTRLVADW